MSENSVSSSKVFQDLGFKPAQAHNMALRARLSVEIQHVMEAHGWNQTEAARYFGITRSRLNDVLRGRLNKVTIDRLVNMLANAGVEVSIEVPEAA